MDSETAHTAHPGQDGADPAGEAPVVPVEDEPAAAVDLVGGSPDEATTPEDAPAGQRHGQARPDGFVPA